MSFPFKIFDSDCLNFNQVMSVLFIKTIKKYVNFRSTQIKCITS